MPVRFTKRGVFLIHRDEATRKWQSISGIAISWLRQYVTADPGVTVSDVLDAVSSSQELSRFLAEYTGCDLDSLHMRDRSPLGQLLVSTAFKKVEGGWETVREAPADVLRISPEICLYKDPDTGDQRHEVHVRTLVASHSAINYGESLGRTAIEHFGDICQLHVRIENDAYIDRCDHDDAEEEDLDEDVDPSNMAVAEIDLLDFLSALYGMFGKPKYSNLDAKTLEEFDDIVDRLSAEDDNDEWWKGNEDENL